MHGRTRFASNAIPSTTGRSSRQHQTCELRASLSFDICQPLHQAQGKYTRALQRRSVRSAPRKPFLFHPVRSALKTILPAAIKAAEAVANKIKTMMISTSAIDDDFTFGSVLIALRLLFIHLLVHPSVLNTNESGNRAFCRARKSFLTRRL